MTPNGATSSSYLNRFAAHFTSKPARILMGTAAMWGAFFETSGHYSIGDDKRKLPALVLNGAISGAAIGFMLLIDRRIASRHPLLDNAGSVAAASFIVFGTQHLFGQWTKERK